MADKIFVGSAKIITTSFGEMTKISFSEARKKLSGALNPDE